MSRKQLALPATEGAIVAPEEARAELAARALEHVANPHADNTSRAYKTAWARWGKWCGQFGVSSCPVEPDQLVQHLLWLSDHRYSPNTVRLALSAIASYDRAARTTATDKSPVSVAKSPIVQRFLLSWGRTNPTLGRNQAPVLTVNDLRRLVAELEQRPHKVSSAQWELTKHRDRAMILVGWLGALRRVESSELDVTDLVFVDRGLELRIRRSKTDQDGEGAVRWLLPQAEALLCAVDAWQRWRELYTVAEGPAWPHIDNRGQIRGRLSGHAVGDVIARHARRVGLEDVTGHSLRATFATRAAELGHSQSEIAWHGRWKTDRVLQRYVRRGTAWIRNPTSGLV